MTASSIHSANGPGYRLHEVLPDDVLVGSDTPWGRYRRWPVFSLPWLRGRTWLFAMVFAAIAVTGAIGMMGLGMDYGDAALAGLWQFAGFMLMTGLGPLMATWVRHRHWSQKQERAGVLLGWLLGIGLAAAIDHYVSTQMVQLSGGMLDVKPAGDMPERARSVQWLLSGAGHAMSFVLYGLLGGGLALRAYFSERQRWTQSVHARELKALQRRMQDSDLRMGVLQAQVEPHFLFNTLASVRSLVRRDAERAEQTLDALVAHLRESIPLLREGGTALHSTLEQQLRICESYLEVMRLRTGGRLSYQVDVDEALRALPYPPLLLLSLVENAVKHGIEPHPGPGLVRIVGTQRDGMLVMQVIDDGVGLREGSGSGIGLANVRDQLRTRHGDHARLVLRSGACGGTIAEITTPGEPRT